MSITLNSYINEVKESVRKEKGTKVSKIEPIIVDLVKKAIENKQAITIKNVVELLNKSKNYASYVRVLVTKSKLLRFEKVNGVNIIVTSDLK